MKRAGLPALSVSVARQGARTWCAWVALVVVGCSGQMSEQPRYGPLEPSSFFEDGKSSRPLVAGTVARGQLRTDSAFYAGKVDGELVREIPVTVDRELIERGQQRYRIACTPCHGGLGDGRGMIVQRGFTPPPSFHLDRLRESPVGHFYDVITNGHGAMYPYAVRVAPRDRWAITAYIRALQLSQGATTDDVPAEERAKLDGDNEGGD